MRRLLLSPPKTRDGSGAWPTVLWLVMLSGTLSFWPFCFDLTLVPRFFFLSTALLVSIFLVRKDLAEHPETRWHIFDFLLLGWCGLNWISVSWSLSWSEGVFYAQKPLLLFGVYWLLRQALHRDEGMVRRVLGRITLFSTVCVCVLLFVQIGMAAVKHGLDNETLYQYASGASGNKSLAAEFLFFLLVFNGLFVVSMDKIKQRPLLLAAIFGVIFLLIFVLQVRTALVALVVGVGLYCFFRAVFETGFRKTFLQKILPGAILAFGLLVALLLWKGEGNSMAERLNPMNYLESATANERRFVWHKTDLLNAEHYWLGVGNGAWKFWMPSKSIEGGYRLSEGNVVFTRAHNDYLEIRSEMGMVGAVWFCALFGLAFLMAMMSIKAWASLRQGILAMATGVVIVGIIRYFEIPGVGFEIQVGLIVFFAFFAMLVLRKSSPRLDHDVLVTFVGLFGYCIIQYFDFPRERIEFQVVLGVLFAILAHKSGRLGGKPSPVLRFAMIALSLGLAFNLLIGWQRMRGEIHNVRLMDAQATGNWRKVISESQQAENNFYEYTDAAIPLAWHEGVAQFQLGLFEKSALAFERAYRLNPWSFQVINNYASALVKLKRYSEAILLFEKALSINPRYDEGKFNLAFVYFQMNDFARSEEWMARVDTIASPANDVDREKNRATLKRLGEFRKVLQEKQK